MRRCGCAPATSLPGWGCWATAARWGSWRRPSIRWPPRLQERDEENARLIAQMQQLNAELESRVIKRTEQLQISNTKLLETQADLRRLSEELMRSTEQERTRISREIHDQLGQLLTAVKMELRTIERLATVILTRCASSLTRPWRWSTRRSRPIRRIASDLRPGILDDFGLEAAVEWQLQQFRDRTGIAVELERSTRRRAGCPRI